MLITVYKNIKKIKRGGYDVLDINIIQEKTIDFSNPEGVKSLNKALLKAYYNISFWDIPEGYLCPPIS